MKDGQNGGDPAVLRPPVLGTGIQAFLQDVQLPAEAGLLEGHPATQTDTTPQVTAHMGSWEAGRPMQDTRETMKP